MTLRKGQKLVNYIRFKKWGYREGDAITWTEEKANAYYATIERYIFYMSDEEFERVMKE